MGDSLLALPALYIALRAFAHPVLLLDFWWHLKTGQVIAESGSLPRVDAFSFTAEGAPYVLQSWLAEILYYGLYRLAGLPALVTCNALLLVGVVVVSQAIVLASGCSRRPLGFAFLVGILVSYSLSNYLTFRTQTFSFLFFVLSLAAVLTNHRPGLRWGLPLIYVLWANIHGGFLLGLFLLGIKLLQQTFYKWKRFDDGDPWSPGAWFALFAACFVATLINPELLGLYREALGVSANPTVLRFVEEWRRPDIRSEIGWQVFFGPALVAFLGLILVKRNLRLMEWVLLATFLAFGFLARRNGAWFSLSAFPILGVALARRAAENSTTSQPKLVWDRPLSRQAKGFVILVGVATMLLSPWFAGAVRTGASKKLVEPATPVSACDWLLSNPQPGRFFHPQLFGDYLLWRLWPTYQVFLDGRVHLYPESVVVDYRKVFDRTDGWEQILDRYGITGLFLSSQIEDNRQLRNAAEGTGRWKVVYEDEQAAILVRPPNQTP